MRNDVLSRISRVVKRWHLTRCNRILNVDSLQGHDCSSSELPILTKTDNQSSPSVSIKVDHMFFFIFSILSL